MSRILTACMALMIAACANPQDLNGDGIADADAAKGRAPDTVSLVAPSNPVGTLSGVVVNSLQAPIEGANVTLILGAGTDASHIRKTTTSADGAYAFDNMPGGSAAQLIISKTGYSTARINSSVPGAAGNFPINDGNSNAGIVTLTQLTGTIKFRVFTAQGVPAKGAKAYLEINATAFVTSSGTYGNTVGNFTATADVDESGLLTFANSPEVFELARFPSGATVNVTIGALDLDGDMRLDTLGMFRSFTALDLVVNPDRLLITPDARVTTPLSILAGNLDSLQAGGAGANTPPYRNALKPNDPITVVFNQPIAQIDTTRIVKVVLEDCQTNVAVTVTQRAPNVLSIAPTASWTLGTRYNIVIRATGLDTGNTVDFIGYFFALDATAPRNLGTSGKFAVTKIAANTMSNAFQPGDKFFVVFDTPLSIQGGPIARLYVNLDLNNDNTTGGMTGFGEFNGPANSGFQLVDAEQTQATDPANGTFNCKTSGYTSRWQVTIPSASFPSNNLIPASTGMKVVFPKDASNSVTFQTAWGGPVTADVGGTLTVQ